MSGTPILFAAGPGGIELTVPEGVNLIQGAAPDTGAPLSESVQRALVATALNAPEAGPPLAKLAAIKRRVAILAGDLSRPAPYDIVLPVIVETLVNARIRPSRIAVLACPGTCGPLLGRAAIHRYGEEICATHEVVAWPADGAANALYADADLRIALASRTGAERFEAFIPAAAHADFGLEISLGKKTSIDIKSVQAFSALHDSSGDDDEPTAADERGRTSIEESAVLLRRSSVIKPRVAAPRAATLGSDAPELKEPQRGSVPRSDDPQADVWITSGGGAPWEETLEEALLSLLPLPTSLFPAQDFVTTRTAVLIFSGHEGLGSAHFTRDVWSLISQAEEVLAAGGNLGAPAPPGPFDPASTLADCFRRYSNTVLFSPGLAEHPEGEDLLERLEVAPHVAARLALCGSQQDLWKALELLHGPGYSVYAEPLGWRARA